MLLTAVVIWMRCCDWRWVCLLRPSSGMHRSKLRVKARDQNINSSKHHGWTRLGFPWGSFDVIIRLFMAWKGHTSLEAPPRSIFKLDSHLTTIECSEVVYAFLIYWIVFVRLDMVDGRCYPWGSSKFVTLYPLCWSVYHPDTRVVVFVYINQENGWNLTIWL